MQSLSLASEKIGLSGILVEPAVVSGGTPPQPLGTVSLTGRALSGGLDVALASNRPQVAQVPASVTVPEGADATFFHVSVRPTTEPTAVVITATRDGEARSANLLINPSSMPAAFAPPTANGSAQQSAAQTTRPTLPPPSGNQGERGTGATADSLGQEMGWYPATPLRPCRESFRAALLIVTPALPLAATIVAAAIYVMPQIGMVPLFPWLQPNAMLAGAVVAIVLALLGAAILYWVISCTSADHANSAAFGLLMASYREIEARVAVVATRTDASMAERIACVQALNYCQLIRTELETPGARWVMGTGYVNLWQLIHRAEQALMLIEPVEEVLRAAIHDELRLEGSQIENSADLLVKLRLAVSCLQPSASAYFAQQSGTAQRDPTTADQSPAALAVARAALAQVRLSIDEFRDDNWDALARTRNHLLGTITATGTVTFLLLGLALAMSPGVPGDQLSDGIAAASAFYLIGAMVGLFNRLYNESTSDNSVEDYGLTEARLGLTPILSGLAAVSGVLVIAMLPSVMSSGVFMVTSGTQAGAARLAASIPTLSEIYSLQGNQFGVVFAGIFGLTPGLLLSSLQSVADKYRASIKSTAPATSST